MKTFLSSFLILLCLLVNAQIPRLDSLYAELEKTGNKERSVRLLNELSHVYLKINLDSAATIAYRALELGNMIDFKAEIAGSHMNLGKVCLYKGQLNQSFLHYDSAAAIFTQLENHSRMAESFNRKGLCLMLMEKFDASEKVLDSALMFAKLSADSNQIIRAYLNFSSLHHYESNYEQSLSFLYEALDIIDKTGNNELRITAQLNLANLYFTRGDEEKALENFLKTAGYCEQSSGKQKQLSYCYQRIGYIYLNRDNPELAEKYGLKSLENSKNAPINGSLVATYSLIGKSLSKQNDPDQALRYCNSALELAMDLELPKLIADCYYDLGQVFLQNKKYAESVEYLEKSLDIHKELNNKYPLSKNLEMLARAYAAAGDFENAWKYQKELGNLQDSLFNEQKEKTLQELETEYKLKEKEALLRLQASELELKNSKLAGQRILNITIGIVVVLLLVIIVLALINIKRRKQSNQQLRELDLAKSRFFSNISHEMRNPLTLIMSPLQKLAEETRNTAFNKDLLLAYNNSKKLLNRVNEILDLSRLDAGKMQLHETSVNLHSLCHRIIYSYASYAQHRNLQLDFDFEPEKNTSVLLDIEKFEKILNNLILNALKHAGPEGKVQLSIKQEKNTFSFAVMDTGKGISPEDMEHIFDRYYQTEQSEISNQGGTGIGLTLAKEYAVLFGGNISVESKPEEGSIFTLLIPLKLSESTIEEKPVNIDQEVRKVPVDMNIAGLKSGNDKPVILIVEDNHEMGRYLKDKLNKYYDSITVPDGVEALKLLKIRKFDLIISDVMMPNMDGFEFREKVRQNRQWKQYPFIMLTARMLEEDRIAGFRLGIDDYITKPFSLNELLARIHNLILNKKERDRWWKENSAGSEKEELLSIEEQFLKKAEIFVLNNIDDPKLNAESLSAHLNYSKRQVERLLKKYSGFTPSAFIREVRLQKAYKLIEQRQFATIKEVCYDVGFDNPASFSTLFKMRFGSNPSEV